MQLGFSLSNKKHAGDAQTMPFRECSFGGLHGKFIQIIHWKKNSIIVIITQKQAFIDIVFLPSYKNTNVLADTNQRYK